MVVDWISVAQELGRVTSGPVISVLRVPQVQQNVAQLQGKTETAGRIPDVRQGYTVRT